MGMAARACASPTTRKVRVATPEMGRPAPLTTADETVQLPAGSGTSMRSWPSSSTGATSGSPVQTLTLRAVLLERTRQEKWEHTRKSSGTTDPTANFRGITLHEC